MKHLIVIPAYNEQAALPRTLMLLESLLPSEFEIVVIDDGSKDGTGAAAEAFAAKSRIAVRVLHLPVNGGIGVAVQTGYLFAEQMGAYQFVIQFDADGQHDASALTDLVAAAERDGLDLCIGSRFLDAQAEGHRSTWPRRVGIRFLAWLIRALGGQRITDPTSGLRLAGPRAWKRFARHYPEDYPEPETLYWCVRNKLKVGEIPVRMHARQGGVTSIGLGQSFYYMLKVTIAILLDRLRRRNV